MTEFPRIPGYRDHGSIFADQPPSIMARSDQLLCEAAQLTQPYFTGDYTARLLTFWGDTSIVESLQDPACIESTLRACEQLVSAGSSFSENSQGATNELAMTSSEIFLESGLHGILQALIEADPESLHASRMTDLLFRVAVQTPKLAHYTGVDTFLRPRIPLVLSAAGGGRERAAPDDSPHHAAYAKGAALLLTSNLAKTEESQAKDILQNLAMVSAADDYADEAIQAVADSDTSTDVVAGLLGISGEKLRAAWRVGYGETGQVNSWTKQEYRKHCLLRMLRLEAQEPGSALLLHRRFGIRNFGRFPESMLLAQYRERDTPYEHRMYLISAMADDNGSSTRGSMPKFAALQQRLHDRGIGMMVVEVASATELKVRGRQLRMSAWPRAAMIMSDSHGYTSSISFDWFQKLSDSDIINWAGELAAELSRPDAIFFVDACSTAGYDDGFSAVLSRLAGRRVCGATGLMSLRSIDAAVDAGGAPIVDITMGGSELRMFSPYETPANPTTRLQVGIMPAAPERPRTSHEPQPERRPTEAYRLARFLMNHLF